MVENVLLSEEGNIFMCLIVAQINHNEVGTTLNCELLG